MSKKRIALPFGCLLALASSAFLPAHGQVWDFLGARQIDGTRDHDQVQITRHSGVFRAIQLRVSGDAIFFDRVVIHFGDGTSEEWSVRDRIWLGGNHIIDLNGDRRVLESVELWYYREPWGHPPTVILYGS